MWKSLAFTQDPKSTPQEIFSSIGVLLTETPLGLLFTETPRSIGVLLTETPDCPASQSLNYNARCYAVAVFLGSASVPIGLLLIETPDCAASPQSLNYNARCYAVAVFLGSASVPILSLSFLN